MYVTCHFKFAGLVCSEAIRKLYGFLWQSQSWKLRYELGQEDFARDVVSLVRGEGGISCATHESFHSQCKCHWRVWIRGSILRSSEFVSIFLPYR